jgi:hypothetical protein
VDVAAASVKAMRDTVLHQANEHTGTPAYVDAQKAIEWAYKEGHLGSFMEHEHLGFGQRSLRTVAGQAIAEHAEYTPRTIAFLSQYYTAKGLGFTEGAARRAAAHGANEIMGDYSKQSKPSIVRNMSPVTGTVVSQLSTFLLNTTSQLHSLATNTGVPKGKIMTGVLLPLVSYLGISYLATGWKGLPGVQDYDNAVHSLNGMFDMNLPTSYELKLKTHGFLGDEANDAYYGKASEKSGYDVAKSGRAGSMIGYGSFMPQMAKNVGISAYLEGKNITHKLGLTEAPSDQALYDSRKAIIPPNAQWLIENQFAKDKPNGNKILKEGIERKAEDSTRWVNPYDPLSERKQRDEKSNIGYREALQLKQTKTQIELIKDKANRQEDFTSNVKKLVELNPDVAKDPSALAEMIKGDQIKRNLNVVEREIYDAIQGESLNKLQNAKHADMVKRLSNR